MYLPLIVGNFGGRSFLLNSRIAGDLKTFLRKQFGSWPNHTAHFSCRTTFTDAAVLEAVKRLSPAMRGPVRREAIVLTLIN